MFLSKLLENQPTLIKNADKKMILTCIEIAGLCHDIGHPPFSHAGETYIIKELQKMKKRDPPYYKHENKSMEMIDEMMNDILPVFSINLDDITKISNIVKKMINGNSIGEYNFLFSIVCNINGLDTDCLVYILEDQLSTTGSNETHKLLSIINNAYVYTIPVNKRTELLDQGPYPQTNYKDLCFNIDISSTIERYFMLRIELYTNIYYHKNTRIRERMMADAFILVDHKYDFLSRVNNNRLFVKFTDNFTDIILNDSNLENDEKIQQAQDLINRIPTNNLYRFVYQKTITRYEMNDIKEKDTDKYTAGHFYNVPVIVDTINTLLDDKECIYPQDIIIDKSKVNQKNGEINPLTLINFYNSDDSDTTFLIKNNDLTNLQSKQPEHCFLRVYLRDINFKNNERDIEKIQYMIKYYFDNIDTFKNN